MHDSTLMVLIFIDILKHLTRCRILLLFQMTITVSKVANVPSIKGGGGINRL